MTSVLVHGVPETAAVWTPLVARLADLGETDVRTLPPPGFGVGVPDGFSATMLGYRDWLVAELEGIGHPIDLVGRDWGGGHVLNVAMTRPDLLRTWTASHRGPLRRDRRAEAAGCRAQRRPSGGPRRLGSLVDDGGPGERGTDTRRLLDGQPLSRRVTRAGG